MEEEIYQQMQTRLESATVQALFTEMGLKKPTHIALYYGQLEHPEAFPAFNTPALFVEFVEEGNYTNIGQNSQQATLTLRVYIVQTTLANGAQNARANEKELHLNMLKMPRAVHYAFAQLAGSSFGKLIRTKKSGAVFNGKAYIHTLEYTCSTRDNIANYLKTGTEAQPESFQILI
jgi:hypothetical protein